MSHIFYDTPSFLLRLDKLLVVPFYLCKAFRKMDYNTFVNVYKREQLDFRIRYRIRFPCTFHCSQDHFRHLIGLLVSPPAQNVYRQHHILLLHALYLPIQSTSTVPHFVSISRPAGFQNHFVRILRAFTFSLTASLFSGFTKSSPSSSILRLANLSKSDSTPRRHSTCAYLVALKLHLLQRPP